MRTTKGKKHHSTKQVKNINKEEGDNDRDNDTENKAENDKEMEEKRDE